MKLGHCLGMSVDEPICEKQYSRCCSGGRVKKLTDVMPRHREEPQLHGQLLPPLLLMR